MSSNLHTESKCLGIVYKEYKPRSYPFNTFNKEKQLKSHKQWLAIEISKITV